VGRTRRLTRDTAPEREQRDIHHESRNHGEMPGMGSDLASTAEANERDGSRTIPASAPGSVIPAPIKRLKCREPGMLTIAAHEFFDSWNGAL